MTVCQALEWIRGGRAEANLYLEVYLEVLHDAVVASEDVTCYE